jgi:RHS repeat-associated protein
MRDNTRREIMKLHHWLAAFIILGVGIASAQVATGTPPFGSFGGGPFDTVNLGNLNVHFSVPILNKPGRGTAFRYDLAYDSSVWTPAVISGSTVWQPAANWGWQGQTEVFTGYITYNVTYNPTGCLNDNGTRTRQTIYTFTNYRDRLGINHSFDVVTLGFCQNSDPTSDSETADDGSGYTLNATGGHASIITPSGASLAPPLNLQTGAGTFTDQNGNQISVNGSNQFFDTLSSTTPVLTVSGSGTPSSPTQYQYTAPSGGTATYSVKYTQYTVKTNFGVTTPSVINEYGPLSKALVSSIVLPDGSSYAFTYEPTPGSSCNPIPGTQSPCVTGRIASVVTLPTVSEIQYTYTGGNNGIEPDGSTATLTRTLNPGGEWQYKRTQDPNMASHWTTKVTSPASDVTLIDFQQDSKATNPTHNVYETQRVINQGASTPLLTLTKCYNSNYLSCPTTAVSTPITQADVYSSLPNGSTRLSEVVYNGYGLVTDDREYNYGVTLGAAPSSTYLVRETAISYAALGNGIVNKPVAVRVSDWSSGTANALALATYNYDQWTPAATSGTPQHTSIIGARGNLTTLSNQTAGIAKLTRTLTYYDTGNPSVATDVNNAQTTYVYGSGSCGNSFATTINEPLSLSRSMAWNCTGGIATQVTDENGNNVTSNYTDSNFWRPANVLDQLSNQTNLSYTGQSAVEASLQNFNSGNSSSDSLTTVDGFGRPVFTQRKQGPTATNYDTSETDYNSLGQPYRSTMPYTAAASPTSSNTTAPAATRTYDALGRVLTITDANGGKVSYAYTNNDVLRTVSGTQTFQKQLEYDGLGRLTSVCEISSTLPLVGACGPSGAQTGLWAKYTYDALGHLLTVTQNAQAAVGSQQTRSFVYDMLGRVTSESNPETGNSGANGTIAYTWDSISPCGDGTSHASAGDLVQKKDNAGNITCYSYDALHRAVTAGNTSVSNTILRKFFYDSKSSYPTGVTVSNGKTQMVEAQTFNTSNLNAFVTDEFFSYSPRGERTDVYEATPHSGSGVYYHTTASYWPTGALQTLSGIPGVPKIYYGANGSGLDGEGRYTQVTAASGTPPVTNVAYSPTSSPNPLGALTGVTFGSADSDSFTYDPNTGRLGTYTYSVNGKTDAGALHWNTNGTLQTLTIADNIPGTNDSQTCNYQYDDLQRVSSSLCGSIWQQNFSYDSFGNITKSGSLAFAPLYSSTTNQFTSLPGVTPKYDANGNLLTDNLNSYTWDTFGSMVTVTAGSSTVTNTYDAFGRMVENNAGGAYTEFLWGPTGAKLAKVRGTTLIKAFIALPGGASAVYTASGLMYYRHSDWLGNSRLTSTATKPTSPYFSAAYAPFGEQYAKSGIADASFTGKDQDMVSSLYDFPFRESSPSQGRWASPDPAGMAAVDPTSPQSWNRYAYVLNNPLSLVDPLGLMCGGGEWSDWSDANCTDDGGGGGGGGGDAGGYGGYTWDQTNALWWNATFSAANSSVNLNAWNNQQDMMTFGDNYFTRPGYANEGAEAMLRYLDPCVYKDSSGNTIIDRNIGQKGCTDMGGTWVPPDSTITVDSNGNWHSFPPPVISPTTCLAWQAGSAMLLGANMYATVATGGWGALGFLVTVPNFVLSNAFCSAGGSTHW